MSEAVKGLLVALLGSKKFAALLIGLLVTLLAYPLTRWAGVDELGAKEIALPIATLVVTQVSAYLVGQGIADHGKEKAKIEVGGS